MRFENQTFRNVTINLDYNEFVNCTIRDCTVMCYGGDFSLTHTTLANCKFGVAGMANSTLQFLKLVRSSGPNLLQELLDQGPQPTPDQVRFN